MPENQAKLKQVLPRKGLIYQEDKPTFIFCKPKLIPLKSITLEKMDKMKEEADMKLKATENNKTCDEDES